MQSYLSEQDFSNRLHDFRLLGWSEEGVKRFYPDEFLNQSFIERILSKPEVALGAMCFSLIFILIIFLFVRRTWFDRPINTDGSVPKEYLVEELPYSNNQLSEILSKLFKVVLITIASLFDIIFDNNKIRKLVVNYFKDFLKLSPSNQNSIIEHFLVILLISYEALIELFRVVAEDFVNPDLLNKKPQNQSLNIVDDSLKPSRHIEIQKRKQVLMKKTNLELKSILKGVSRISNLKKSELVDKVLFIEFN